MNVTVFFLGICTHVVKRKGDTHDGEIENVRVVLPNASFGRRVAGQQIPPHSALIWVPQPFIAQIDGAMPGLQPTGVPSVWSMNGVSLDIHVPGLPSGRPEPTKSYNSLPSLTRVLQTNRALGAQPLELDRAVVDEGGAACVFSIGHGTLDALRSGEAVHGKLRLEVPDGGAAPQLRIVRQWDGWTTHITLQTGGQGGMEPFIIIANTGTNDDKEIDFLLHYGVTTYTPDAPLTFGLIPTDMREAREDEEAILQRSPIVTDTVTHGCSNSIYP